MIADFSDYIAEVGSAEIQWDSEKIEVDGVVLERLTDWK